MAFKNIFILPLVFVWAGCTGEGFHSTSAKDRSASEFLVAPVNEGHVEFANSFCLPSECAQIGVNYFDLFIRYLPSGSGYDGSEGGKKAFREMGRKAIRDLVHQGIRTLRFTASGYGPTTFDSWSVNESLINRWRTTPEIFWQAQDAMYEDINALGLKVVPTLNWSLEAFPALTGSTIADLITNPNSEAFRLQAEYFRQYVSRYKDNPAILYWEIHNEANLLADLDMVKRCQDSNAHATPEQRWIACGLIRNYTSRQLIDYGHRVAAIIRSVDISHPISGGYANVRPNALHFSSRPEFSPQGPDWRADSYAEFVQALRELNAPFDILSVHIYPVDSDRQSRPYLRSNSIDDAEIIDRLADASREIGKPLYIGELGEPASGATEQPTRFLSNAIQKIKTRNLGLASLWVWQFYQAETYLHSYDGDREFFLIEPGFTDALIGQITRINRETGAAPPKLTESDDVLPEVVVTWPFHLGQMSSLQGKNFVHVVASDNILSRLKVEIQLNGASLAVLDRPPYQAAWNESLIRDGRNLIRVRVTDAEGNQRLVESAFLRGPDPGPAPEPVPIPVPTPEPPIQVPAPTPVEPPTNPGDSAEERFSTALKVTAAGPGCDDPCQCAWIVGERFPGTNYLALTIRKADWSVLNEAKNVVRGSSSNLALVIPEEYRDLYRKDGLRFTVADHSQDGFWDTSDIVRCEQASFF